jgi:hypothetical protein
MRQANASGWPGKPQDSMAMSMTLASLRDDLRPAETHFERHEQLPMRCVTT